MSAELFERARDVVPGGVSSPARAFGAVGGDPLFCARAEGPYLWDTDGERYVDYVQGFGAVILGHTHARVTKATEEAASRGGTVGISTPDEIGLAELVCERVPTAERVRFVASGTEAGMTAARIARGITGRDGLVKFEGCYHGHADAFLAKAGSSAATFGIPMAAGVPEASVADTVVLPFNDREGLERVFSQRGGEIAAVFVEPVPANMGVVLPSAEFLADVRRLCTEHGALCVFDEVVTGFRLAPGGAQEVFGLDPDLTMLGKVLGGGLPVGAVAGPAELMDRLAPTGEIFQAGTYASHPHAMAAGAACLDALDADVYDELAETARTLQQGLEEAARDAGVTAAVPRADTILSVFFRGSPPQDFDETHDSDTEAFARFHRTLRASGVLVPPSPFEAWFPSVAHTSREIDRTLEAARKAFTAAAEGEG